MHLRNRESATREINAQGPPVEGWDDIEQELESSPQEGKPIPKHLDTLVLETVDALSKDAH
ncbi:MAG: hypothetical protein HRU17_19420 [Polyangiaceae bacterium]|nr:hypothetical protein [Polyangiaceae bacterium]